MIARRLTLTAVLLLSLSACGPKTPAPPAKPPAEAVADKARRCPDPDIRDSSDPCSVAYLRRSPPRFTQRDPLP